MSDLARWIDGLDAPGVMARGNVRLLGKHGTAVAAPEERVPEGKRARPACLPSSRSHSSMTTFKQPSATPEQTALHRFYEAGEFQQALHLLDESDLLATLERQPDDLELTDTALVVANLYRELGRFSPAESFYLQALAGLAHAPGKDHPEYARALVEFAQLYQQLGRHDQALPLFEQARAVHAT